MFNLDAITNKNNKDDDKKMATQNVNNWTLWIRKN